MDLELLQYAFFRNALAGVALISVACAMSGVSVVTRRMTFIAGGITHTKSSYPIPSFSSFDLRAALPRESRL